MCDDEVSFGNDQASLVTQSGWKEPRPCFALASIASWYLCLPLSPVERVSVNQAFIPPSTVRFAPVIYEDSGPATNATKAATSSTCP